MTSPSLYLTLENLAPGVKNHVWQSTLFVIVAALLSFALRKYHARTRYWIWLVASLKFLVPFSLLVSMGGHWAKPGSVSEVRSGLYFAIDQFSQPFPQSTVHPALPAARAVQASRLASFPTILAGIWLFGFLTVLIQWLLRWRWIAQSVGRATALHEGRELAALRRMERTVGARRPITLLLSSDSAEPGIFGIFRPILLWPTGISAYLEDAHLEAIFAHELGHVRHRDNLVAAVHMLVESLFWFHPLVWWLGTRLMEERERSCDEEVLQLCDRPQVYAESILKVCEFCLESPLACVAGVTGSDLKQRIGRIMAVRLGRRLGAASKTLLASVALLAAATPLGFGVLYAMQANAPLLHATTSPLPSFEVATIKPNNDTKPGMRILFSPANFSTTHSSLKDLIKFAYHIKSDNQFVGGPNWMSSEFFDIQAKASDSEIAAFDKLPFENKIDETRLLIQSLLADRFQLKVSFKTEELPVYALVVAKDGPKLKEVVLSPPPPTGTPPQPGAHLPRLAPSGPRQITASAWPMNDMADWLSGFDEIGDRMVIDETGLKGNYDWVLNGVSQGPAPGTNANPTDPATTSIFTALQEQLGLKLSSQKVPVEVLVIDHVEKPSEN
jgi:uncharacterized protein (TIGR03435 family)